MVIKFIGILSYLCCIVNPRKYGPIRTEIFNVEILLSCILDLLIETIFQ